MRAYEYYRDSDYRTVSPEDPSWRLSEFLSSSKRGKRVRPLGKHVVLLHFPYEEMHGSLHLPGGSMVNSTVKAVVLDVPSVSGRSGYYVDRAKLAKKAVTQSEKGKGEVFVDIELVPGDVVYCLRFAGDGVDSGFGSAFDRMRTVDYGEIYGYAPTGKGS